MDSFKDVYTAMVDQDLVKEANAVASEQLGADMSFADTELLKQAQDYDYIGRSLAHQVLNDLVKEAMDEEMPYASEDKKKEETDKVMAKARGEKSDEDKESDEYKKKMKEKGDKDEEETSEKKASIQASIMQRMSEDPAYVSYLISKHYPG